MSKIGLGGQAYPRVGQTLSGGRSLTSWTGAVGGGLPLVRTLLNWKPCGYQLSTSF